MGEEEKWKSRNLPTWQGSCSRIEHKHRVYAFVLTRECESGLLVGERDKKKERKLTSCLLCYHFLAFVISS